MSNIDIAKTYIKAVQTGDQATLGASFRPMLFGTSQAKTSFPACTVAWLRSDRCWAR